MNTATTSAEVVLAIKEVVKEEITPQFEKMNSAITDVKQEITKLNVYNDTFRRVQDDHEARIRILERIDYEEFINIRNKVDTLQAFNWKIQGMAGLITVIISAIIAFVLHHYLG